MLWRRVSKSSPKPTEPRDGDERRDDAPRKPQRQSGATEGRGSGRGSSKSPTATPWSRKDQVVSDEQQDAE